MRVLVVAAHPDDEVIGMGGMLKKLSRNNYVEILFLADGITGRKRGGHKNSTSYSPTRMQKTAMSKEIERRKEHAQNALNILGVKKFRFLDMPDNELDLVPFLKIVKEIEVAIQKTKCDTIFTHQHGDLNIDHRFAYEATVTAARPLENSRVNSIIAFESMSASDGRQIHSFRPNLFIDITKELSFKIRALKAYKNEIRKFPHPRSKESLEAAARRWGSLYGYRRAEAFEIVYARSRDFPL